MRNKKMNFWFVTSIIISFLLCLLIMLVGPYTSDVYLLPDQGAAWYYWKLPHRYINTMIIVWVLFFVHLFGNYYLIKKRLKETGNKFTKNNLYLLVFNFIFIILHLLETVFLYDGLAQDMPIFTSQYSVILVLIVILVMESTRRGIFFGYKVALPKTSLKWLYATHGFLFVLAIIYTFWFHPMIFTVGHIFGFFYIFLLMIQFSFIKTKIHYNSRFIVFLEILVAFHAVSVAVVLQNSAIWSMFGFGFLFIFFATQIYGLGLSKIMRRCFQGLFLIVIILFYWQNGFESIHQVLWIPIIEYGGALIFLGALKIIFRKKDK